jgi:Flp pilus assembly protein TadG
VTVVYVAIVLVAVMAIASLAVDLGRAQCAKTELHRAAYAAARYGATGIDDGTAITKAIAAAADNLVDGTPLVLTTTFRETPKTSRSGTSTPR